MGVSAWGCAAALTRVTVPSPAAAAFFAAAARMAGVTACCMMYSGVSVRAASARVACLGMFTAGAWAGDADSGTGADEGTSFFDMTFSSEGKSWEL